MHHLVRTSFVATGLFFLTVATGCSSSDSGSTTSSSGNGNGGGNGTGGGNGGGAQNSSGSTPAGVTAVACYKAADKRCDIKGEGSQSGIDQQKASCTSGGGTPSDHCPSDGLVGCCIISGLGQCSYDASAASSLQNACGAGGGTWSTSAP